MFSRTGRIKALLPVDEVPESGYEEPFELDVISAPVVTGMPLRLFTAVLEGPMAGPLRSTLLRQNRLPQMLDEVFVPERPTFQPTTDGWPAEPAAGLAPLGGEDQTAAERASTAAALLVSPTLHTAGGGKRRHHTAADFQRAYASGATTPSDVAERIIAAVAASEAQDPPMRFFVAHEPERLRHQAAASSRRWKEGRPLSPLDGVPFAVKDCVDALPYPTTGGTGFMADWRTPTKSLAGVQALLDAGALLVGKATLHEIGLGTTGLNTVTGTARNPHHPAHHTGASSSGSGALLAAGICPLAVGTDGGGSIRIPAGACGVVGLKPTHERVGTEGCVPPIDQTVAVTGPMGASLADCALLYAMLANVGHPEGNPPPLPIMLPDLSGSSSSSGSGADGAAPAAAAAGAAGGKPLAGKKAGVCWPWFDLAAPAVAAACRAALKLLEEQGLEVVSIGIPELALLRAAHACTIASEMRNNMNAALQDGPTRRLFNFETRVSLAVASGFTAAHYIQAQKIRTRVEAHFRRAFSRCDFIVTPTLPCTAPPINPAALRGGQSDLTTTSSLMQYMLAANFIGLPALTVPIGAVPSTHSKAAGTAGSAAMQAAGAAPASTSPGQAGTSVGGSRSGAGGGSAAPLLPVGLQLMAPCWHEGALLHAGAVLESAVAAAGLALPVPPVWWDVLEGPLPSAGGGEGGGSGAGGEGDGCSGQRTCRSAAESTCQSLADMHRSEEHVM